MKIIEKNLYSPGLVWHLAHVAASDTQPEPEPTNMNKPSTLDQIRNIAEFMFNDKAISSIDIDAAFGMVRVYRNGRIEMI